jgi:hypothetical protein
MKDSLKYPIAQPTFEFVPFEDMTKEQAKEHFDWFVSIIPERLALLRKTYNREMGRQDLDYTFESLNPLWAWMRRHVRTTGVKEVFEIPRPPGAAEGPPIREEAEDFTFTTLALAQDASMYVGEVFIKGYPFIHWALSKVRGKQTVNYNLPVLEGVKFGFYPGHTPKPIEINPMNAVMVCLLKHADGTAADDELAMAFQRSRENAERSRP